jgi:anti-anti-sigma regulatory factor
MKPSFVELYASSSNGIRAQATSAVDDALHRGATLLVLGLDNLPALDDAVLSAAIVALRRLREIGGNVRLATQNPAHQKRLAQAGLDRIFAVDFNKRIIGE